MNTDIVLALRILARLPAYTKETTDIVAHELKRYGRCFRSDRGGWQDVFVSASGRSKIRTEWPEIWRDLELDTGMDEDG